MQGVNKEPANYKNARWVDGFRRKRDAWLRASAKCTVIQSREGIRDMKAVNKHREEVKQKTDATLASTTAYSNSKEVYSSLSALMI